MSDYYAPQNLKVDTEFKNLLAPLSQQEYKQLEANIKSQGCLEPLTVWNQTLIDGHNRYQICVTNNIPFRTRSIHFSNRTEALIWICTNQLGRRNISEEIRKYLIGKKYELEKTLGVHNVSGYNQHFQRPAPSDPSAPLHNRTAYALGKEFNISHSTVYKYGIYSRMLDEIQHKNPEIAQLILAGKIKISHENLTALAKLSSEEQSRLLDNLFDSNEEQVSYSHVRHKLRWSSLSKPQKKRVEYSQTDIPIKQLPKYDPDAELSSLSLTIPSWISSINRTRDITKFENTTAIARENLKKQLCTLQDVINNILILIKEDTDNE